MKKEFSKKLFKILLLVLWMALIFFMSSQVATTSSGLSSIFVEPIRPYVPGFTEGILTTLVRKSAHIFLYFVLGVFVINFLKDYLHQKARLIGYSILFVFTYAVTDEIHQIFVPGRSSELRDVIIDTLAASLGVAIYYVITNLRTNKKVTNVTKEA